MTNTVAGDAPGKAKTLLRVLGPGLITGASDDEAACAGAATS